MLSNTKRAYDCYGDHRGIRRGNRLRFNEYALGIVNGIGFSLISIYLCINVIKYINKKLSLPVLMNKVADFLVLYGVLRLTLSFMSQYIEYSRISALFTEPDIMTFLFVGIAIKLALKTKQEKDYEISTAEKKLS